MLHTTTAIGFGTMELCISPERPSLTDAQKLLIELVDEHGLTFIDTADSYAPSEDDFGYGEVLASVVAKRPEVIVATKGGFIRPGGTWTKKGDSSYIASAIDASLARLGVERITLYQFHTPDPNVPIEESLDPIVRAQKAGKIDRIGVSNFDLDQLQRASSMATIASVQNPLSILSYDPEKHDPMLRYCEAHDITFLAYAPMGGFRNRGMIETVTPLVELARRAGETIYSFALQILIELSPCILPIPGSIDRAHIIANLQSATRTLPPEIIDEVMREVRQ